MQTMLLSATPHDIEASVRSVEAATSSGGSLFDVISAITNFGVLVVIGAIVVIFLAKVLNNSLSQTTMLVDNVSDKLKEISDVAHSNQSILVESINSHNSHVNTLLTMESKDIEMLRHSISAARSQIEEISDRLISIEDTLKYMRELESKEKTIENHTD